MRAAPPEANPSEGTPAAPVCADDVGRLLAILAAEERVQLEMRDLLQRERELMARLDAEGLGALAREKEALADEGRLVEEGRTAAARALARRLGIDAERPTLSQLCEALGSEAAPLRQAHTRLVVLVSVVRELLDANVAFAGDNLTRITGTLQTLGRLLPVEVGYGRERQGDARGETGRLVRSSA